VNINRALPWFLVVALGGGVVFALLSKNEAPAAPISAAPAPAPLDSAGQAEPDDEPDPTGSAGAAFPDATLVGVVREHFDVAQYTYLRLATDAGDSWAAVYRAPIKDGATVSVVHAARLAKFHSRELNRDFDAIWFGMLPGYETAPASSAFPQSSASPSGAASAASASAGPPPKGTTSIADLAKNAPSLEGKLVKIAGHVVKETDGVLERNWIHIQDGSGSAKDGSNDVLVTTDVAAAPQKLGDEVVATGTVRTNQDFGAGYAYKFMLEKAALTARTR
jgi:hypothetical protein